MNEDQGADSTRAIAIYCRIRPLIANETPAIFGNTETGTLVITPPTGTARCYKFDHVFTDRSTQADVFSIAADDVLQHVLQGFNGALLAYGATCSGKTHTISGPDYFSESRGLIPRTIEYIFGFFNRKSPSLIIEDRAVTVSFVEVYMEKLRDLLASPDADGEPPRELQVYSFPSHNNPSYSAAPSERLHVEIHGLTKVPVDSPQHMYELLDRANTQKVIGSNQINQQSSRSHTILIIDINYRFRIDRNSSKIHQRSSQLHIADLAGSESILRTRAVGERLTEAKYINTSLLALGKVVNQLSINYNKPTEYTSLLSRNSYSRPPTCKHVSYRDSLLTRILQTCLNGDSVTAILVHLNPDLQSLHESLSTIKFATRAAHIRTSPVQTESILDSKAPEDFDVLSSRASLGTEMGPEQEQDLDIRQLSTVNTVSNIHLACISDLRSLVRAMYNSGTCAMPTPASLSPKMMAILACALDRDIGDEALPYILDKYTEKEEEESDDQPLEGSIIDIKRHPLNVRRQSSFIAADPQAEDIQRLLFINVREYVSTDALNRMVKETNNYLSQLYDWIEHGNSRTFLDTLAKLQNALETSYKRACIASVLRIRREGSTLLSLAIENDVLDVIGPLLQVSPLLANEKDEDGMYPLHRLLNMVPKTADANVMVDALELLLSYSSETVVDAHTPDGKSVIHVFAEVCASIDDSFAAAMLELLVAEEIGLDYAHHPTNVSASGRRYHIAASLVELDMPQCVRTAILAMKAGLVTFSLSPLTDDTFADYMDALEGKGFHMFANACFKHNKSEMLRHAFSVLTPNYKLALVTLSSNSLVMALANKKYACAAVSLQVLSDQAPKDKRDRRDKRDKQTAQDDSYLIALNAFFSRPLDIGGGNEHSVYELMQGFLGRASTLLVPSGMQEQRTCVALLEMLLEDFAIGPK